MEIQYPPGKAVRGSNEIVYEKHLKHPKLSLNIGFLPFLPPQLISISPANIIEYLLFQVLGVKW